MVSPLAASDAVDSSDGRSWPWDRPQFSDDGPISLPEIALEDLEDNTPSLLVPWPCAMNPHLSSPDDRSLFNHYLNTVARVLSRSGNQDDNPFLATLLPIAATSDTVTSIILGLSGRHWKRVYPTIWNAALARQGKGKQSLSLISHWLILGSIRSSQYPARSIRPAIDRRSMHHSSVAMSVGAFRRALTGLEVASKSRANNSRIARGESHGFHPRTQLLHQPIPLPRCLVHYLSM